ncbi:PQQ-dependent sugar dehydrogenase [Alteriqipengyuania lutimaris]|uniref:PQQ-dependent sugar dehydrogenase n=1 Tax=Alteriqipengyuania lutimaris TaxID=1538146 RepID=A0A395LL53_9SPHN|nr:PQQ-dependent sugar dehydrogenase [Alteriqipengyuania lutimaris]MBB3033300.1 glucose/arabinose dehydrogenase [Alteriqipengyuania lutimaris]RDS77662.1 PQQ-dependent sugar dehydrogenase [Alteriqipengyuania lutimaris]
MTRNRLLTLALTTSLGVIASSCGNATTGENAPSASASSADAAGMADETVGPFAVRDMGTFDEPWATAFVPGTAMLAITEKAGSIKIVDTQTGTAMDVSGAPTVDYGGQGGLGDIAFLPGEASSTIDGRTIYLSWAEAGDGDTRGAVVGRGELTCEANGCAVEGLNVIWRQTPKVTGRGHYSHRIAFSPDEQYMFVSSGDRQKQDPAQDTSNTLGTVVRLNLDGSPAAGNPLADQGSPSDEIWSWGHRNVLGLAFDPAGRLWDLEHGPAGGDELNHVERGNNYGWPLRSEGDNYNGTPIPDHTPDDGFTKPAIEWTPVIAPGDFIFYTGSMFADWRGDALIANLKEQNIVRVDMNGTSATEAARYDFGERLRDIVQGPDGALYVIEDGEDARLRKLTPAG